MSAPAPFLAGGGQQSRVGAAAVLLTEYAPVKVINTSLTSTVWLANTSSVSTGNGVPLEPGTAYDWETPGLLYAVLDPAATDASVQLVLTGSGGAWSPSPAALAAQVAVQLVEQGIPQKLLITDLDNCHYPANTVNGVYPADMTPFLSVFMYVVFDAHAGTPNGISWQYQLTRANGQTFFIGQPDTLAVGDGGYIPSSILPVMGEQLTFSNPNSYGMTVVLFGYNRKFSDHALGNGFQSAGLAAAVSFSTPGTFKLAITAGLIFQGPAYMTVGVSSTGLSGLFYQFVALVPGVGTVFLFDSTQAHAYGSSHQWWQGFVALPSVPFDFAVITGSVPSAAIAFSVTAIPNY